MQNNDGTSLPRHATLPLHTHPTGGGAGAPKFAQLEPLQVTIREAARLLRYDERTVRRFIARGKLHAIGRGRLRRIALADILAWQATNRC